jgi:hypothetical protein
MTIQQYLIKARQDDARRAGEQDRLLLEARRARKPRSRHADPAARAGRLARLMEVSRAAGHGETTCPAAGPQGMKCQVSRDTRANLPSGQLIAGHRQINHPRTLARTRKKGTPTMFDRLAAYRPPTIRNLPTRTRRSTLGAAAVIPALLIGVLGCTHSDPPRDSGLIACAHPLTTQDVPAAGYAKLRAEFARSHWPDLRNAGTAYVDLAVQLRTARSTDGYQTVWFYQRLSAACAKHRQ